MISCFSCCGVEWGIWFFYGDVCWLSPTHRIRWRCCARGSAERERDEYPLRNFFAKDGCAGSCDGAINKLCTRLHVAGWLVLRLKFHRTFEHSNGEQRWRFLWANVLRKCGQPRAKPFVRRERYKVANLFGTKNRTGLRSQTSERFATNAGPRRHDEQHEREEQHTTRNTIYIALYKLGVRIELIFISYT